MEAAGERGQVEAWFKELSDESGGQQQSTAYRRLYLQWLKRPMQAQEAYLQRAIMNLKAKCYLQAILLHRLQTYSCIVLCLLGQGRLLQCVVMIKDST